MPKVEVSIWSITQYIGDRSRPLQEGEAVFKAGHVILCGVEENSDRIKALCLQTSALTSPPHEITISLNEDVTKWNCICSCKAGLSGYCKHIVATLIYVNRYENLAKVSCTDLTQKWGKEKAGIQETYKCEPFKNFCHPLIKKKKVLFKSSLELDRENFALLSTGLADSALTTFLGRTLNTTPVGNVVQETDSYVLKVSRVIDLSQNSIFLSHLKKEISVSSYNLKPCCQDLLMSISKPSILEVATKYRQGSEEWLKERQLRITGSTCYSIYTYQKDDWETKALKFFFPKGFQNKFTQHGKKYEPEALQAFINKHNCDVVTPGLIISAIFPWLGFSPDGIIIDEELSTLLEIKCPYIGKDNSPESFVASCEYLESVGSEIVLKENHTYYGQIQLGMAILGLSQAILILYSSFTKTFLQINVPFNEIFARDLIKQSRAI